MACYMDFMLWFVPSFDEIGERKAELGRLEAQIIQKQGIKNIDISRYMSENERLKHKYFRQTYFQ